MRPLRLEPDGGQLFPGLALPLLDELAGAVEALPAARPGRRIVGDRALARLLGPELAVGEVASLLLGRAARPVRAILFDKRADANWALGWHQDRTIAVRERLDVPGFGPWSVKQGIAHAEPPEEILRRMVTARVHLDAVDDTNGPLEIVPGSHAAGRLAEDELAAMVARGGAIACHAAPGDVWLYRPRIVHRSGRARGGGGRRVLHVDYCADHLPGGLQWHGI